MIQYATAAEAEAALGRAMTWAEAAWFRYSADVADCWLYCHNALILFLAYTLTPLPLALLEQLAPDLILRYKLQPRVRLPPAAFLACYWDSLYVGLLVVAPFQLFTYPIVKMTGLQTGLALPSAGEIAAQVMVYSLVDDYLSYWIHRLMHANKWAYNTIHRAHHEFTAPMGFTSSLGHWAEVLVFAIPIYVGPCIVPCHVITLWIWLSVHLMESIETHCGYGFPFSPANFVPLYGGAEYHDYHHRVGGKGKAHSNFSPVFTYCDYVYGTDKGYRYHKASLAKVD